MPAGISRTAVQAFFSSKRRSMYRLKPIAADRAKTMQSRTFAKSVQSRLVPDASTPKKYPIIAKGSAKTVWLNFTNDK